MDKVTKIEEIEGGNELYVSNIQIQGAFEEYRLELTSGQQLHRFVVSPGHAKRLAVVLLNHIQEYEKTYGEVKTQPVSQTETGDKGTPIGFSDKEIEKDD